MLKNVGTQTVLVPIDFHSMNKNAMHVSRNEMVWLPAFFKISSYRQPYRFRMTWGQVHDNRILGWTVSLSLQKHLQNVCNSVEVKQLCVQLCVVECNIDFKRNLSRDNVDFLAHFLCAENYIKMMILNHELTFWQIYCTQRLFKNT